MNKGFLQWGIKNAKGAIGSIGIKGAIGKENQHFRKNTAALQEEKPEEVLAPEEDSAMKLTEEETDRQTERAREDTSRVFSRPELEKAMIMGVILGAPACRKRKRYEGNIGRR